MLLIVLFCLFGLGILLKVMGSDEQAAGERLEAPPTDLVTTRGKVVRAESNHGSSSREMFQVDFTYSVESKRYSGEQWLSGTDYRRTCSGDPTIYYSKGSPEQGWVVPHDPKSLQAIGTGLSNWGQYLIFFSGSGLILVTVASLATRRVE